MMCSGSCDRRVCLGLYAFLFALLVAASSAHASSITLSDFSSDSTPASHLDAVYSFNITGATELTLTVQNTTGDDGLDNDAVFNLNEIYFNAVSSVTGLTLTGATHSVEGDVFAAWDPVAIDQSVAGFGIFDFGLIAGVGITDPDVIGAGESVDFIFTIAGVGPFVMTDFVDANLGGFIAAGKFVSCRGGDCVSDDDSAFGAAVPEPGTALLIGFGLVSLSARRRAMS